MKLGGIIEWINDVSTFRGLVHLADDLGYDVIGAGDTPARAHELYTSLAVAAQESRNATLTPMVTTPFLRHPSVTATAISTLHKLAGGRVMLAIGNGGSAARILGRTTGATQQELRDYVTAVREILNGGTACVDGRTTERLERVCPMPVYVAADHPKSLRLAGEIADGVITTAGLSLELVEKKIATVRAAAEKAGRDPETIEIWGWSFVSIRDSRAEANAEISTFLASDIGLRLKAPHTRAIIPPELLGAVEEMERRYDFHDYTVGGKNARLLEELGLVDFAAGRCGLIGNIPEVAHHLKRLELLGVSCLVAPLPGLADPEGTLRRLSQAAAYA